MNCSAVSGSVLTWRVLVPIRTVWGGTDVLRPRHRYTTLEAVLGCAVLVMVHGFNLAACCCDRLLLLRSGPTALGAPEQVLRAEALRLMLALEVLVNRHLQRGHRLAVAR